MRQLSFKRYRFPLDIIRYAIWLYARFTLSFRDIALSAQANHGHHMRMSALTATSRSTTKVAKLAPTIWV
jgi:transposase-like protein